MSHHELKYEERIRDLGYRLTPQRQMIMDALCAIGDHARVTEVYARVHERAPAIDLATVYRTLHFFHGLQLVTASEIDGDTVYEVAGTSSHHHLLCRVCGQEQTLGDADLHDLVDHLGRAYGFTAELQHLVLPGVCRQCRAETKAQQG